MPISAQDKTEQEQMELKSSLSSTVTLVAQDWADIYTANTTMPTTSQDKAELEQMKLKRFMYSTANPSESRLGRNANSKPSDVNHPTR